MNFHDSSSCVGILFKNLDIHASLSDLSIISKLGASRPPLLQSWTLILRLILREFSF